MVKKFMLFFQRDHLKAFIKNPLVRLTTRKTITFCKRLKHTTLHKMINYLLKIHQIGIWGLTNPGSVQSKRGWA